MDIVVLYDFFSPAYKAGGPVQSLYNLTNQLKCDLNIDVISSNKDLDGVALNVPTDSWLKKNGVNVFYSTKGFFSFKKHIKKANTVFFINGIYSLHFNLLPFLFLKGRKIISPRGMLHPAALKQKQVKKRIYLSFLKFLVNWKKCEFHVTNEEEKVFVENTFGTSAKIWIASNLPNIQLMQLMPKKQKLILGTIALISPMKNHLLVLKALKEIQEAVEYRIYGPIKDADYWKQCQQYIKALPSNINVVYKGEIEPQNLAYALKDIHVYIQPSNSENFGHSFFEAFTTGRPVITSFFTPWNNLKEHKAGINVDISSQQEIKESIILFSKMDNEELTLWGGAARNYALEYVNIADIKKEYLQMFCN